MLICTTNCLLSQVYISSRHLYFTMKVLGIWALFTLCYLVLSHANRRSWRAPRHPAPTFCLIRIVVHDLELLENRQHIGVVLGARATGETGSFLGADAREIASRVGVKIPSMLALPAPGRILSSSERTLSLTERNSHSRSRRRASSGQRRCGSVA